MSYLENNPFTYDEYRVVPWAALREFEKSYMIHQAQVRFYLTETELAEFIKRSRMHDLSWYSFPLIAAPSIYYGLKAVNSHLFTKKMSLPAYKAICLLSTVGLWFGFSYINPFYKSLLAEKEQLMRNLEGKLGVKMLSLNDMLQYHITERRMNREIRRFNNRYNSVFNDLFYTTYEIVENKFDKENGPVLTNTEGLATK